MDDILIRGPYKNKIKTFAKPEILDTNISLSTENITINDTFFHSNYIRLHKYNISEYDINNCINIYITSSKLCENDKYDTVIIELFIYTQQTLSKILNLQNNILTISIDNCIDFNQNSIILNSNENSLYYVDINENDIPLQKFKLIYSLSDKSRKWIEKFLINAFN